MRWGTIEIKQIKTETKHCFISAIARLKHTTNTKNDKTAVKRFRFFKHEVLHMEDHAKLHVCRVAYTAESVYLCCGYG